MLFHDRFEAGKRLAARLVAYKGDPKLIILAIPRGALQIGVVLAEELHAPLDIFISKKIGMPRQEELAIGAVSLGVVDLDEQLVSLYSVPKDYIAQETTRLQQVIEDKYLQYTGRKKPLPFRGKTAILCDDGIATGHTMAAAVKALKKQRPAKIIIATPVSSREGVAVLSPLVDEMVVLETPEPFFAIGQFYDSFPQVDDEEAIALLHRVKK